MFKEKIENKQTNLIENESINIIQRNNRSLISRQNLTIYKKLKQLDLFTQRVLIEPWDEEAARHYGTIRAHLKREGRIIGSNDLLIAAHARSIDAVIVTNNTSEFSRVPDLTVEDWLEKI